MTIGIILFIVMGLALLVAVPNWPHSRTWGYGPAGGIALVLIIVFVLFILGRI